MVTSLLFEVNYRFSKGGFAFNVGEIYTLTEPIFSGLGI